MSKFIIDDEGEYWEEKIKEYEKKIIDYINLNIRVVVHNGLVVDIKTNKVLTNKEVLEIIMTTEGYLYSLKMFDKFKKEDTTA